MKVPERKRLLIFVAISGLILAASTSLYMYFSHNAEELLKGYPRNVRPSDWVSFSSISPYARSAIVLSEDWAFFQHEGFDSNQMKVAIEEAAFGGRVRGASTITQQMVKNVWLSEDRTLWRKFHELILAYKVDSVLSKKRILEIYLNVIEFGPGIYGIKKAATHYFKKAPAHLTPRESAFLAMLLPSPKRYYISFKKRKLTTFAVKRINEILIKMRMGKAITPEQYQIEKESRFSWESY